MPQGDRTGPDGQGPMTGRMAGFCAGNEAPGYASAPMGRRQGGFGRGSGGRRYRNWQTGAGFQNGPRGNWGWNAPPGPVISAPMMSTEQELSMLQNQAAQLEQTLTALQRRIADLTKAEQNR
jgi:hypothetical protein